MRWWFESDTEPATTVKLRLLNAIIEKEKAEKKAKELASRVVRFPGVGRRDLPRSIASRSSGSA